MDNKSLIGIVAVVVVVFLAFVFALPGGNGPEVNSAGTAAGGGATKTSDIGSVTIDLTPVAVNENEVVFNIGVNTHSVDLSAYDLAALSTLTYNGKTAKASSTSSLSGHHNSGTLSFKVDEKPSSFTVAIVNLPEGERKFTWP